MGIFNTETGKDVSIVKAFTGYTASIIGASFVAYSWIYGTFVTKLDASETEKNLATKKDIDELKKSVEVIGRSMKYQRIGIIDNKIILKTKSIKNIKDKDIKYIEKESLNRLKKEKEELEVELGLIRGDR